jgi:hypothetical protein
MKRIHLLALTLAAFLVFDLVLFANCGILPATEPPNCPPAFTGSFPTQTLRFPEAEAAGYPYAQIRGINGANMLVGMATTENQGWYGRGFLAGMDGTGFTWLGGDTTLAPAAIGEDGYIVGECRGPGNAPPTGNPALCAVDAASPGTVRVLHDAGTDACAIVGLASGNRAVASCRSFTPKNAQWAPYGLVLDTKGVDSVRTARLGEAIPISVSGSRLLAELPGSNGDFRIFDFEQPDSTRALKWFSNVGSLGLMPDGSVVGTAYAPDTSASGASDPYAESVFLLDPRTGSIAYSPRSFSAGGRTLMRLSTTRPLSDGRILVFGTWDTVTDLDRMRVDAIVIHADFSGAVPLLDLDSGLTMSVTAAGGTPAYVAGVLSALRQNCVFEAHPFLAMLPP